MREYLFRGKLFDGEWVEGSLRKVSDRHEVFYIVQTDEPGDCGKLVAPETVGQYTGLTDKNGKKIFEGDIVEYEDSVADFEGYHDDCFTNRGVVTISPWEGVSVSNRVVVDMDDLYISEEEMDAAVIGNIHDNPELLEE